MVLLNSFSCNRISEDGDLDMLLMFDGALACGTKLS
jgi:hypothetical protein